MVLAWIITRHVSGLTSTAVIWLATAVLVLLIGFSRVYFGVHYLSDVIGAYLAALVWTITVAAEGIADPKVISE